MIYHNITDLSIYSLHTNRECNENKNNIIDEITTALAIAMIGTLAVGQTA